MCKIKMDRWSKLPVDLLLMIEENLLVYVDKVRIRAVCVSWYSDLPKLHDIRKFPSLVRRCNGWRNSKLSAEASSHELFSLLEQKSYNVNLPVVGGLLKEDLLLLGSSHGWIITFGKKSHEITIIDPFTRNQFKLPHRSKFPDMESVSRLPPDPNCLYTAIYGKPRPPQKIVLSSAPDHEEEEEEGCCIAIAIYGIDDRIAYSSTYNGKGWKEFPCGRGNYDGFEDILFKQGKLYALRSCGVVFVFDGFGDHDVKLIRKVAGPNPLPLFREKDDQWRDMSFQWRHKYLAAESLADGQLLLVLRGSEILRFKATDGCALDYQYRTLSFKVFKLDSNDAADWCWKEVKDIGDDMILFLGRNSSFSFHSSSQFPTGYDGNCIFFSNNLRVHPAGADDAACLDIGVFRFRKGTVEPLSSYASGGNTSVWPLALWIAPRSP